MQRLREAAEANSFEAHDFKAPRANARNPMSSTFQMYCAGMCATCRSTDALAVAKLLVRIYASVRPNTLTRDDVLTLFCEQRKLGALRIHPEGVWSLIRSKFDRVTAMRNGFVGPKELADLLVNTPSLRSDFKCNLFEISKRLVERDEMQRQALSQSEQF